MVWPQIDYTSGSGGADTYNGSPRSCQGQSLGTVYDDWTATKNVTVHARLAWPHGQEPPGTGPGITLSQPW